MARALTPQDAHVLMNALVHEALGENSSIQTVNASNFVSVGETVLASGVENTLNSLALVLGKRFMAVRPYRAKLALINALNTGVFTHRLSKVSFYSRDALASGDWNTQLNPENLLTGVDNTGSSSSGHERTPSMWEQNAPIALELNFAGSDVWEDSTTVYRQQLQQAFRSEDTFNSFVSGVMTEKGNDIESQKEAYNRLALLSYMGGLYDVDAILNNGMAINLTTVFNNENGTNYTTSQLKTTYYKEFLAFFVAYVKKLSRMLEYRSANRHWTVPKTVNGASHSIMRHTPRDRQKMFLFEPFFIDAEAKVLPEVFNDEYLKLDNYEGVMFWQNPLHPSKIDITPAIPDVAGTGSGLQKSGNRVQLDTVLGVIFDSDALMIDYQLEDALSTPVEARKRYYNMWWSFAKNIITDYTENGVLLYMADGGGGGGIVTSVNLSIGRGNITFQNGDKIELSKE